MRWRNPRALAALLLAVGLAAAGCQNDVQSRLAEIQALQEAGAWEASIEPLRELLATHSANSEVNYRLGLALVQTGRHSLAVWPLQKAAESDDYAVQGGMLLTATLVATGDHTEAIHAADGVLEREPENLAALNARARAKVGAKDPDGALADAERALSLAPGDRLATSIRIGALIDLERLDEAEKAHVDLKNVDANGDDPVAAARSCGALAVFYEGRDKIDEARATHRECAERYPDNPLVRGWISNFYVSQGEIDEAAAVWREAIDAQPENPNLRGELAKLLEEQGRAADAEPLYLEDVELFDTVKTWRDLAFFYRRTDSDAKAVEALQRASEKTGGNAEELQFELADLLIDAGRLDEAREAGAKLEEPAYRELLDGRLKLVDGDAKGALASLENGLRRWPNNAGARYLAGVAALQLDDRARARSEFREAVRADQAATEAGLELARMYFDDADFETAQQFAANYVQNRPFTTAEGHLIGARAATAIGRYVEAENVLNDLLSHPGHEALAWSELARLATRGLSAGRAIAAIQRSKLDLSDPANEEALRSLVDAWLSAEKPDEALEAIEDALAKREDHAPFHELRSRVLVRAQRLDEGKAAAERALSLDPMSGDALVVLGSLAAAGGDLAAAQGFFERAVAADETNPEAFYSLAHTQLLAGDSEGAITALRSVVANDPLHSAACNDLAWLLAERGDELERALALARRSVRIARNAQALDTLGYVQLKLGDGQAAVDAFTRALSARDATPSIRYRLGLALVATGRNDEAREAFETALAGDDFPEAAQARAELDRLGSNDA